MYAADAASSEAAPSEAAPAAWLVRLAPRRVPERLRTCAGRLGLAATCSLGAAWIHVHHDPGALCPLRRLTGIPCPVCGSTTVFMEAGAGHWTAALTANPFTVLAFVGLPRRAAHAHRPGRVLGQPPRAPAEHLLAAC